MSTGRTDLFVPASRHSPTCQRRSQTVVAVGGGGEDDPPAVDPSVQGLLKRLPKSGDVWPERERDLWLGILKDSFKLIYKDAKTEEY